jgi:hypothetical protein
VVTVLVSVVNIIVRTLTFALIDFIGYETESERVAMIMKACFLTVLINTGFLGLLVNANFEHQILLVILPFRR